MPRRSARTRGQTTTSTTKAKAQQQTNAKASGSKVTIDLTLPDAPSNIEDGAFDEATLDDEEDSLDEDDGESDEEFVKKTTRGKRKRVERKSKSAVATRQPPRKKAKCGPIILNWKDLSKMTFDVLHEIFAYLSPLDLLHIAWSNKANHEFLYSPACESIWKAARRNFSGLPECPDDMTEPQYAYLAFGQECYACGRAGRALKKSYTIWSARKRICAGCMNKSSFVTVRLYSGLRAPGLKELKDLRVFLPIVHIKHQDYYCSKTDKRWEKEYRSAGNKEEWLQAKIAKYAAINEHANACAVWEKNCLDDIEQAKKSIYEGRVDALLDCLEIIGWQIDVLDIRNVDLPYNIKTFSEQPIVMKVCQKDLTERIFQNQRTALEGYMQEYRTERLTRLRQELLRERIPHLHEVVKTYASSVPANTVAPGVGDFFRHKEILDFVIDTPSISSPSDFNPIRPRLPEIAKELLAQMKDRLLAVIKETAGEYVSDPATVLELATTTFECETCRQEMNRYPSSPADPLRYPRILAHGCARKGKSTWNMKDAVDKDTAALENVTHKCSWNRHKVVKFDKDSAKVLKDVVELCGLDPKTMTKAAMDELDPIIECLACNSRNHGRMIMRWDLVPHHFRQEHDASYYQRRNPMKLEILVGEDAETIRGRLNEDEERMRAATNYKGMACVHCREPGNTASLRKHVIKEHGIAKPSLADDIVPTIDSKSIQRTFHAWPPRVEVKKANQ